MVFQHSPKGKGRPAVRLHQATFLSFRTVPTLHSNLYHLLSLCTMDNKVVWAPVDDQDYQVFWQAVVDDDLPRLKAAWKPHVNVDTMYGDGFEGHAALHEAASKGYIDVTRHLLACGASVDILDQNQFGRSTPLFYAARGAHVKAAQILLNAGADISIKGSNDNTILSAVLPDGVQVGQAHMDTITLLLDSGSDINERASAYGPTIVSPGAN